jgi:hypothetical protein
MYRLKRLRVGLLPHRIAFAQVIILLICSFVIFESQASAVIRFNDRSLYINSAIPGAVTSYKVSLTYNNTAVYTTTVGSIDMLFCEDPIPYDPCVTPPGLDASHAVLSNQSGETGFGILSESPNEVVLTRNPQAANETPSTYNFTNIINPTDTTHSFSIRLSDYPSTDASGSLINLGSIISEVTNSIEIDTQVPPILIFCVAGQVNKDCSQEYGGNYTDLGDLYSDAPTATSSQMAVATNATNGFVITANGPTIEAGTNIIPALPIQTVSAAGNNQFGINLRANTEPQIGSDIDDSSVAQNAYVMPNYNTPNEYMYKDGDVVAEATGVNLGTVFTVSYIVNDAPNLHAGVYTTTITYICSGRF